MGHLYDESRVPVALRGQEVAVGGGRKVAELVGKPLRLSIYVSIYI